MRSIPSHAPLTSNAFADLPEAEVHMTIDTDQLTEKLAMATELGQGEDQPFGLHLALAVQHCGEVVAEVYGTTADANTALISWSKAKSFTHAMVGMLVLDGVLDPAAPAPVPRWADDERSKITLQHLLEMNSGLEFVEDYVDGDVSHVIEMLFGSGKDDVADYAESFPLVHQPGTVFNYSSGTTNIISAICDRAIKANGLADSTQAFLQQRLFDPLGMSSATIQCDDQGTFIGSSFVFATARDFAKFGQLYLDDGVVADERLLPEGWVQHGRTPVSSPVVEGHWYGAQWWLWDHNCDPSPTGTGFDCSDINGFGAHGYEGQYTVVVPDRDLVVVRLGKTPVERQPEVRAWIADIIRCFPTR